MCIRDRIKQKTQLTLKPVINATGVILHTNLGRSVLAKSAVDQLLEVSRGFSTLEFDLETGKRGSRSNHAQPMLVELTGAEDALVVNNNAAAVLLVLTALVKRKKVAISRGQLVEIGGGFRVPEVMQTSGAQLVEVGTTNRVRLEDYRDALEHGADAVMRAHPSNFKIIGFTEEPELADLVILAHDHDALFIDDLGSGALIDTSQFGIAREPTAQDSIKAGADIVCFSGDKLLGGPQAGIILGKKELINKIKKHPLARAVRADKLCLAALEATLAHYLKGDALKQIPTWKMISTSLPEIKKRADNWRKSLGVGTVEKDQSTIGGGSLPGETLDTYVLSIQVKKVDKVLKALRQNMPPIIARVQQDRILFDPRSVLESEEEEFLLALQRIFKGANDES
jgi:L-seryl-tRNA(Ser) seleniumtransferase